MKLLFLLLELVFLPATAHRVDTIVRVALDRQHVAGAAIAIVEHGRIVYAKGYGLRNVDDALHADENTSFDIGSNAKQFTAAAIMLLAEQGKLNVADPLAKYLPNAPHASELTLRNLLNMTSGLADYIQQPTWVKDVRSAATPEQIVATIRKKPLAFKPGTAFDYCNTNYVLLAMVVSKVAGQPYADFIEQHFFHRLNLQNAHAISNTAVVHNSASGYTSVGLGPFYHADYLNDDWFIGPGAIAMSALDVAKWDIALDSGVAVSPASFAAMSTSGRLTNGKPTGYGFGLGTNHFAGHTAVSHLGGINGFISTNWTVPADGVAIVLLTNGDNVNPLLVYDIAATLYGVPVPKRKHTILPQTSAERERATLWLHQALTGSIAPEQINAPMVEPVPRTAVADYATLGKRLGTLEKIELLSVDKSQAPMTAFSYRATFAHDVMNVDMFVTAKGQLGSIALNPWYDF